MNVDDERGFIFFDLDVWAWTCQPDEPAHCWLMVKNNMMLPQLPWECSFLLSVDDANDASNALALSLVRQSRATSLEHARVFFAQLDQGVISRDAVQTAFRHLRSCVDLERDARFVRERREFSQQFSRSQALRGLRGFLKKENYPFRADVKIPLGQSKGKAWLDY